MSSFITSLQRRSEKQKLVIAGIGTFLVVAILLAGWGYNLAHLSPQASLANIGGADSEAVSIGEELEESFARFQESMESLGLAPKVPEVATTSREATTTSATATATTSVGSQQSAIFLTPTSTKTGPGENPADVLY